MKISMAALLAGLLAFGANAADAPPVKLGVLTDQSGVFADLAGRGSVTAAEMAVEDFGGQVLGRKIQVIAADHQNKPDIGLAIAKQWYDTEDVDVILDVPQSAIALGVQQIARERNKLVLYSSAGTSDLTGTACSPVGIQWTWDTDGQSRSIAKAIIQEGGDTWFFLTADFAFGKAMERDASHFVEQNGGKVLGAVHHPLNTSDFSSFLVTAQASKAKIVALANGGTDTANSIKQAAEFGLARGGQKLAALAIYITDVNALGLEKAQGLLLAESWYWDQDAASRAWSQRFFAVRKAMPTSIQAGVYSSVMHYLNAVKATGSLDGPKVATQMRAMPVDDFFAKGGAIRANGRMVHDTLLMEVKRPADSKYPWDYYHILRRIPGEQVFRSAAESGCPLTK
ncbi:MAG TPA: ABC transporter substrate-binding protein [Candidatus Cybelea sp.]|nr:ABC transporter substrate-binding protein [Candidatus Cybelea sp.]